jgi:hypothetical protein
VVGTGRSAVSMETSGSGIPRQSIQLLGHTENRMSWLAQTGSLEHPENGNAGIGPEIGKGRTLSISRTSSARERPH